eukprot:m.779319 g.779319  ORF g.779319 m.779319 type:complete len:57 (+) comp23278_c0_seq14:4055-4225(+)
MPIQGTYVRPVSPEHILLPAFLEVEETDRAVVRRRGYHDRSHPMSNISCASNNTWF